MKKKYIFITIFLPIFIAFIPSFLEYLTKESREISYQLMNTKIVSFENENGLKIYKENSQKIFGQKLIFKNTGNKTIKSLKIDANFIGTEKNFFIADIYIQKFPEDNFKKYQLTEVDSTYAILSYQDINPNEKFEVTFITNKDSQLKINFDSKDLEVKQTYFIFDKFPNYIKYFFYSMIGLLIVLVIFLILYLQNSNKKSVIYKQIKILEEINNRKK